VDHPSSTRWRRKGHRDKPAPNNARPLRVASEWLAESAKQNEPVSRTGAAASGNALGHLLCTPGPGNEEQGSRIQSGDCQGPPAPQANSAGLHGPAYTRLTAHTDASQARIRVPGRLGATSLATL